MSFIIPLDKYGLQIHLGCRIKYDSSRYGKTYAEVIGLIKSKSYKRIKGNYEFVDVIRLTVKTEPKKDHPIHSVRHGYKTNIYNFNDVIIVDDKE